MALVGGALGCSDDEKVGALDIFGNSDGGKTDVASDTSTPDDAGDAADEADAATEAAVPGAEGDAPDPDAESDAPIDAETEASTDGPAADCDNESQDGDETDVDCGGSCPDKCAIHEGCKVGEDCQEGVCENDVCLAPTCSDGVQNGEETDQDCGTPLCGDCQPGQRCIEDVHCSSGVCEAEVCQSPTCTDKVENGDETAVDCGGSCTTKCAIGQGCKNASDCVSNICQGNVCACPSGMANVPVLQGGGYCIDSTEVTWSAYQNFVLANPPTSGQIAACSWNSTYIPDQLWPPAPGDTRPVTYVDWCDAYAYCNWAGKRLCGEINGAAIDFGSYQDVHKSEWFNACSAQAVNVYPYGDSYESDACAGADSETGPVSVGSHLSSQYCIGGVPSLTDMSGNVAEWVNACQDQTATSVCRLRGGSYESSASELMCSADDSLSRSATSPSVGFRCCL